MSDLPSAVPTLTTGDIVSNGFRLYRSNFRTYFVIALRSTLWLLLPFVGLMLWSVGLSVSYNLFSSSALGLTVLIFIALFVGLLILTFQAIARAVINMALITRLAYGEFTNASESVQEARKALKHRGRPILLSFFFTFLILLVVNIGLSIANVPLTGIFSLLFRLIDLAWLAFLLANLITFSLYTWISARFFLVEVPLVLEDNLTAIQSIRRSWTLAQGSVLRILLVMTIAFLVTIPLYSLASVPTILGLVATVPAMDLGVEASQAALLTRFLPGLAVGMLLLLAMNMMVMGFWQSIKAVMYYDLRSRREGFDIRLSHRQSSPVPDRDLVWATPSRTIEEFTEESLPEPIAADPPPELEISQAAKSIAGQLLEQADCAQLSQANWWQLRNYLQNRNNLDPAIKAEQSLELARHCRQDIGLSKLPQKMTGDTFLEALYWAIVNSNLKL